MATVQKFTTFKTDYHKGYTYEILRQGSYGQDTYIAYCESLSIRTEAFATVVEAEKEIQGLIERTYAETFKGAAQAEAPAKTKKAG